MKITQEELKIALELHEKWLSNKPGGVRLDLTRANLSGLDLRLANLNDADLMFADLSSSNLSGADLRRANLSGSYLRFAILSDADLSGADLRYANLSKAHLGRANLSQADLRWAILSDANLSHADLSSSNLRGADLSCAILSDVDLRWANTINTEGLDVICVQLNTSDKNRQIQYYVQLEKVTAGCFSGTLDELRKAVDEKHDKESVIYKLYQIAFKTIEDILAMY